MRYSVSVRDTVVTGKKRDIYWLKPYDHLLIALSMTDHIEDTLPAGSNQSVTISARILGELASSANPLGVSEIARRLGESKARVFRHLATMKQCGLVSQENAGDAYQLGWNIYRLGVAAANQFGLTRVAQRHMTKLRDNTQETIALAIPASGDALVVGSVAGALFVVMFTLTQNRWKIDDVLGVWPLHGLCGTWGGIAAGIFGSQALGGLGGVSLSAQLLGTAMGVLWAVIAGFAVYGLIKSVTSLRLTQEEEFEGADLSLHRIGATPDREVNW